MKGNLANEVLGIDITLQCPSHCNGCLVRFDYGQDLILASTLTNHNVDLIWDEWVALIMSSNTHLISDAFAHKRRNEGVGKLEPHGWIQNKHILGPLGEQPL